MSLLHSGSGSKLPTRKSEEPFFFFMIAGFPATKVYGLTFLVTTLLRATSEPFLFLLPLKLLLLMIYTSSLIVILFEGFEIFSLK